MKRLLLVGVALTALFGGAALGAELRRPAYEPPPPAPPPVLNWSGCYIGGYVGGAWNARDAIFTDRGNSTFTSFQGALPEREVAIRGMSAWTTASSAAVLWAVTISRSARPLCSGSKARRVI
jgi:opacity protein-like surface antigen